MQLPTSRDKTIVVDQLATTDLRSIKEIWLGGTHTQLCLWRGEQAFTHEMMSEGTHDQNVRRLCLQLVDSDDQAAVASIELIVREQLKRIGKEGAFYPAEEADIHQEEKEYRPFIGMRPAKSSTQPRKAKTWRALKLSGHQF